MSQPLEIIKVPKSKAEEVDLYSAKEIANELILQQVEELLEEKYDSDFVVSDSESVIAEEGEEEEEELYEDIVQVEKKYKEKKEKVSLARRNAKTLEELKELVLLLNARVESIAEKVHHNKF